MYLVKPTEQERDRIKSILQQLSQYYARPITDRQMEMYIDDLIDMGSELTEKAAIQYRRHWNNHSFPMPAQLRGVIRFITRDLYVMNSSFSCVEAVPVEELRE